VIQTALGNGTTHKRLHCRGGRERQVRSERRGGVGTAPDLLQLLRIDAGGAWVAQHSSRQHQKRLCWPSQASRTSQRMLHETGAWLTRILACMSTLGGSRLARASRAPSIGPTHRPRPARWSASRSRHHPGPTSKTCQKVKRRMKRHMVR
jgi:hypothetical protein